MNKLLGTGAFCIGIALASTAAAQGLESSASHRTLFDKYCVTCHNQRTKAGDLTLDNADVQNIAKGAETWEKVLRKLRTNTMPPRGNARPEDTERERTVAWLDASLDRVADASPNPDRKSVV